MPGLQSGEDFTSQPKTNLSHAQAHRKERTRTYVENCYSTYDELVTQSVAAYSGWYVPAGHQPAQVELVCSATIEPLPPRTPGAQGVGRSSS